MDVKRLILVVTAATTAACASVPSQETAEYRNFQKSAMAFCIGAAFSDESVKSDFNKSAAGFMERGNMPLESYEDLRAMVARWIGKDYPSKLGGQVNSAKCFDLLDSQELAQLYDKYNPCDSQEGWLSRESFEEGCN